MWQKQVILDRFKKVKYYLLFLLYSPKQFLDKILNRKKFYRKKLQDKKIVIKIAVYDWDVIKNWGDYYFAIALKKYLERRGWKVKIRVFNEWNQNDFDVSVVLVLRGLTRYIPKPWHINLMWNISHPDDVDIKEYESYDHVFVASKYWEKRIKKIVKISTSVLLQCTDPEVFKISKRNNVNNNILFVGSSRGVYRDIVKNAIENNFDVDVYGKGWYEFIDKKYIKGEFIVNEELYKYYASAKVVLNDHWGDMAEKGFVSNRIYDALATEAVVLSDIPRGIDENIKKNINYYNDKSDFSVVLNDIIHNNKQYREKVKNARQLIIKEYSFETRVKQIEDFLKHLYI